MTLLFLLFAMGVSSAAPVGNPVSEPSLGLVHLDVLVGASQVRELDARCTGDACEAISQRKGVGAEAGVTLARGLGLYGAVLRESDAVREANYNGKMTTLAGGVRLSLPVNDRFWLASTTDVRGGRSQSHNANRVDDPARASGSVCSSSLLAVLGDPSNGVHLWIGGQGAWLWAHALEPLGVEGVTVQVPMKPKFPVSGVLGATVLSDVIGSPWRSGPRLRMAIEGRVGQEIGLQVTTGVTL